jgi:hypothetical protein
MSSQCRREWLERLQRHVEIARKLIDTRGCEEWAGAVGEEVLSEQNPARSDWRLEIEQTPRERRQLCGLGVYSHGVCEQAAVREVAALVCGADDRPDRPAE